MKLLALGWVAAGLVASVSTVSAATLRLDATSLSPDWASFEVVFSDTGDGLLQYEEITSHTGLLGSDGTLFDFLAGVPTIPDISTVGGPCNQEPDRWCFVSREMGLGVTITTDEFTYLISAVSVDEPGLLSLLAIGMGVLVRLRRRETPH